METVYLTARADEEGHLTLDLPDSMRGRELRVTVVAEEPNPWDGVPRDELGYPLGFRERFFGAFPDAPDEPEELPLNEPCL